MSLADIGQTKREIASLLIHEPGMSLAAIAERLGISREAVRIQVNEMIQAGWVVPARQPRRDGRAGRPATLYQLTCDGMHLFPKRYDTLDNLLLEAAQAVDDEALLNRLLGSITERSLRAWQRRTDGLPLEEKLARLKGLYAEQDPFIELEHSGKDWRLTEYNCPYRNVALKHPVVCSTTVNLLTRLLRVHVVRERRMQDGENCCTFRIQADRPSTVDCFQLEPERPL